MDVATEVTGFRQPVRSTASLTFSASHTASFVASTVVQVRKPRCVRI
ncbi:hypothetical protein [Nonomuraea sp. NPDC003709]